MKFQEKERKSNTNIGMKSKRNNKYIEHSNSGTAGGPRSMSLCPLVHKQSWEIKKLRVAQLFTWNPYTYIFMRSRLSSELVRSSFLTTKSSVVVQLVAAQCLPATAESTSVVVLPLNSPVWRIQESNILHLNKCPATLLQVSWCWLRGGKFRRFSGLSVSTVGQSVTVCCDSWFQVDQFFYSAV